MSDDKVLARVADLKRVLEEKQLWTRMDSVNGLVDIFKNSKEDRPAVAISAIRELNNMHGFNAPTQVEIKSRDEVDLSNLSDDELHQLAKIKGKVVKKNANPESD
jgi:rRNA processing protein Krr1/Pno1